MGNTVPRACLGVVISLVVASLVGCRKQPSEEREAPADRPSASGPADGGAQGAVTGGTGAEAEPAPPRPQAGAVTIPWISDDYPAARARARAEKKPIFVDMWAPWCHTCLSMKQVVMVDPSLAPYLDRFIWLEIDTDRPKNAELLTRFAVDVWPTFYVVSPESQAVQGRHLGAASIAQLRELLDGGEAAHQDAMERSGALPKGSPAALMRAGDRAAAAGDSKRADREYEKALAAAPADWPRIPELLVKQIAARFRAGDYERCAELGMAEIERAARGRTASVTDFAYYADECAAAIDEAKARGLRDRLRAAVSAVASAPDSAMSIDDRSDALVRVRELSEALGDPARARAAAERQRALLDEATAAAPSAMGRMTYVWPRSEVYVYLDKGKELMPELEKLAAELPDQYDPPYRLAWVALKIGDLDRALSAARQSEKLIYGPRKARVLILLADIEKARGDVEAERAARKVVVDFYRSLPRGHRNEKAERAAREALAAVGEPAPAPAK